MIDREAVARSGGGETTRVTVCFSFYLYNLAEPEVCTKNKLQSSEESARVWRVCITHYYDTAAEKTKKITATDI